MYLLKVSTTVRAQLEYSYILSCKNINEIPTMQFYDIFCASSFVKLVNILCNHNNCSSLFLQPLLTLCYSYVCLKSSYMYYSEELQHVNPSAKNIYYLWFVVLKFLESLRWSNSELWSGVIICMHISKVTVYQLSWSLDV